MFSSFLQPGISDTAIIHLGFNEGVRAHVAVSWITLIKNKN